MDRGRLLKALTRGTASPDHIWRFLSVPFLVSGGVGILFHDGAGNVKETAVLGGFFGGYGVVRGAFQRDRRILRAQSESPRAGFPAMIT